MDKGIVDVLERGEGEGIEFKSAYTNRVGRTICAFANTKGGTIYLGISDKGNNRSERAVGIKDPHDVISKVQELREMDMLFFAMQGCCFLPKI